MATATVLLVYLCGRALAFGRRASLLAAAAVALMPAFVYYGGTGNLEAPYLFWFAVSTLFLIKALRTLRLRDCLLFAATAALAVTTKDQAYALYLLSPWLVFAAVLRSHAERGSWVRALGATLGDRRIWLSALIAAGIFALVHNLLFDLEGFARHLRVITGYGTFRYRLFPATLDGHAEMAALAVRHVVFLLSWPFVVAAAVGLALALRAPRANARLLGLAGIAIAYYLGFIVVVGYHYDRFMLGPAILLALFAGFGLDRLLAGRWIPRWAATATLAVVLLFALARALGPASEMLADGRYATEEWLGSRAEMEEIVGFGNRGMLPRGLRALQWGWLIDDGCNFLDDEEPRYIVVNGADQRALLEEATFGRLMRGELGYDEVLRARGRALIPMPSLDGVLSNLDKINREILVFERTDRECSRTPAAFALVGQLREDPDPELERRLLEALFEGEIKKGMPYGEAAVAIGLLFDRWSRGVAPAAVALRNDGDSLAVPWLKLGCLAARGELPVAFRVRDGEETIEGEFTGGSRIDVRLSAMAPGEERLVIFWAEKGWSPGGADQRELGVSLLEVALKPATSADP
jgi:hypothetical protein